MIPSVVTGKCKGCGIECQGVEKILYCFKCGALWEAAWIKEMNKEGK